MHVLTLWQTENGARLVWAGESRSDLVRMRGDGGSIQENGDREGFSIPDTVQPSSVMVTQLLGFCGIVALTLRLRIPHRAGRFEPGYPGRSLRVPTDEWLLIDRSEDVSPAECWPQYVQT